MIKKSNLAALFCSIIWCMMLNNADAAVDTQPGVQQFIAQMVSKHGFDAQQLQGVFRAVDIKQDILQKIASPAEAIPWYRYRPIFLNEKRIEAGLNFWKQNSRPLQEVSLRYGVPESIIVAIIGVETQFGQNTGGFRVIDALSTLGFAYPKRSAFFLSELENFLLLCREEGKDPLQPMGSYAGAMGLPQFMPSSYRNFAVDFDGDKYRDIWQNPNDAIASVANYFAKHQWHKGETVFEPVLAKDQAYQVALDSKLELNLEAPDLARLGLVVANPAQIKGRFKLLAYPFEFRDELWLGFHNYFVITRYNRSPLYAMVVFQLAEAMQQRRQTQLHTKTALLETKKP